MAPLNHRASISPQVAKAYVLRLKKLAVNNWVPEQPPRPALGYVGFDEVADKASPDFDQFISSLLDKNEVDQVNQSTWLFSHSGMRIPSEEVFKRSYKEAVIDRLKEQGRKQFGQY